VISTVLEEPEGLLGLTQVAEATLPNKSVPRFRLASVMLSFEENASVLECRKLLF